MSEKPTFARLEAILKDDGSYIREQFILAGLFLTVFERLKDFVVGHVEGFLADNYEFKNGELRYIRGEEFKKIINEKGKRQPGQHSDTAFRGALHWFFEFNAITKEELDDIERLHLTRNEIGHELLQVLADDKKKPIEIFDIILVFSIYVKIARWWFKEVEATVNPDLDEETYNGINWDEVETFDTMLMRDLINKSLSGNQKWEDIIKAATVWRENNSGKDS